MDFTFGIITYNSGEYVIELLESIKYQIINYSSGRSIQLIIGDDKSEDDTVLLCEKWTDANKSLFDDIIIIKSKNNNGTVINYNSVLDNVKGKFFHIIAGDDLYSCANIFEFSENLNEYDIVTGFPVCLSNNKLFWDYHRLYRHCRHSLKKKWSNEDLVKREIYGSFIHSPSTVFRSKLYNENVRQYVNKFSLYEDDPKWIRLFEKTTNILFCDDTVIIYRQHTSSVCHNPNKRFIEDCIQLNTDYLNRIKNPIFKFYIKSKMKSLKNNGTFNFSLCVRGIESQYSKIISYIFRRKEMNAIIEKKDGIQNYYDQILDRSRTFKLFTHENYNKGE